MLHLEACVRNRRLWLWRDILVIGQGDFIRPFGSHPCLSLESGHVASATLGLAVCVLTVIGQK
jgi:hypothetical protein